MSAAVLAFVRQPGVYDGICRAINSQTEMLCELNRRLDVILTGSQAGCGSWTKGVKWDKSWRKLFARIWRKGPGIWLFGFAIEKHQQDSQGTRKTTSLPDPKQ
ncbi:hypothetical protein ATANTOWER_011794 [Ataeniobius toweri]|uniref:Uncharacterized protein n=1 Tax=Ataeniobius toweri TaxID=208326 RepID=A0ABU7BY56_9TELE|nr:hypothetical protein [Ataeniobius toweri]